MDEPQQTSNFFVREKYIKEKMLNKTAVIMPLGQLKLSQRSDVENYCPIPEYGICLVVFKRDT